MSSYRRTGLLVYVAALVAVVFVSAVLFHSSAVGFFGTVLSVYLLVYSVTEATKRLEISSDVLRQRGYFGKDVLITVEGVSACTFRRVMPLGRAGFRLNTLDIVGTSGNHVVVSRGGWGSQRQQLLTELNGWLARGGMSLGPLESKFLKSS